MQVLHVVVSEGFKESALLTRFPQFPFLEISREKDDKSRVIPRGFG